MAKKNEEKNPEILAGVLPDEEFTSKPESLLGATIEKSAEQLREEEREFEESVQYKLDPAEKALIVDHVIKLVDDCKRDRADWEQIRKESLDLLEGKRPPKSDPWKNCSNISTMIIPTFCKLLHAKLLPAVYNENLIFWRPQEKSDVPDVEKVSKFMGWVVRQDLKFQDIADDSLWDLGIDGTIVFKTRWEIEYRTVSKKTPDGKLEYEERPYQHCEVDVVPVDEVYLPKLWKGEDKSEFIAQDIYNRLPEIKELADRKIYQHDDIEKTLEPKLDEMVPGSLRSQKMSLEGTAQGAINAYKYSLPVRLIECYLKWPIKGKMEESVFTIAYESKAYLSGKPLSAVSQIGRRPYVIGQLIRRTKRPYGIGLPEFARGLAKELDAIHNQRIDAGSIAIAPFGFYRAASSFKPENVQIGPGVMIPVDDINDVKVIQLQHNPIASFQEERIIIEFLEKLFTISAYQMGRESDIVKTRATATGTMALLAQGEQAFTVLGIRCQAIYSRLFAKILQEYQMHMPEGFAERIIGEEPGKLLFPGGLNPGDIAGQYDCYQTLDVTAGSKAMERQASQILVQMAPQLMALAQDPRGYEYGSKFIKSLGEVDVEKYLGPRPVPQVAGMPPAAGAGIPVGPGLEVGGGTPPAGGLPPEAEGMGEIAGGGLPG